MRIALAILFLVTLPAWAGPGAWWIGARFAFQDATGRPWKLSPAEERSARTAASEGRLDSLNRVLFESRLRSSSPEKCQYLLSAFQSPQASSAAVEQSTTARWILQYHSYYDFRRHQVYLGHMPLTAKLELPRQSRMVLIENAAHGFYGLFSARGMEAPLWFYELLVPFRVFFENAFRLVLAPRFQDAAVYGAEWEFYSRLSPEYRADLADHLEREAEFWIENVPDLPVRYVRAGGTPEESAEYNRQQHIGHVRAAVGLLQLKLRAADKTKAEYLAEMKQQDQVSTRATVVFYLLLSSVQTLIQPWEWIKISAAIAATFLIF